VTNIVDLPALARQLASRAGGAEANVQAHIQTLLLYGGLNLGEDDLVTVELEAQAGGGRRIDIETGLTVIEVKRDLRQGNVREEAIVEEARLLEWPPGPGHSGRALLTGRPKPPQSWSCRRSSSAVPSASRLRVLPLMIGNRAEHAVQGTTDVVTTSLGCVAGPHEFAAISRR
jgi:hypothetical protein